MNSEGDADATVEHRAIIGLIREDVAALRDVVNQLNVECEPVELANWR